MRWHAAGWLAACLASWPADATVVVVVGAVVVAAAVVAVVAVVVAVVAVVEHKPIQTTMT